MNKITLIILFCTCLPIHSYCQEYEEIFNFLFQKENKKNDLPIYIEKIEKKAFLEKNYIYKKFFNDSLILQNVIEFEYITLRNISDIDFMVLSYNTDIDPIYQYILDTFTTTNIRNNSKKDWDRLKNGIFIFLDVKRKKIILSIARFMEFGHIYKKTLGKKFEKLLKNSNNFLSNKFLMIESMNNNSPIVEFLFQEKIIRTWYLGE